MQKIDTKTQYTRSMQKLSIKGLQCSEADEDHMIDKSYDHNIYQLLGLKFLFEISI